MIEKRHASGHYQVDVELRAETDAKGKRVLIGYPAKFNVLSVDLGGFQERIAPGAFMQSIKNDDIRALFEHDSHYVLGRNRSGTLQLWEDETGLRTVIKPPDTQLINDMVMVPVERGDVSHMSFGFITIPPGGDSWTRGDDIPIRTLQQVQLVDVAVVSFPAYPQTDVVVDKRSMPDDLNNITTDGDESDPAGLRVQPGDVRSLDLYKRMVERNKARGVK